METELGMGVGFPEAFAPKLRMQDTALSRREESLVPASAQDSPPFIDAASTAPNNLDYGGCAWVLGER